MPRAFVSRELLASREDVWSFIAEPHHFADWWPGIAAVRPDRRGLAEGARWEVQTPDRPTLFRRATSSGMLLVREIRAPELFAWTLTGDHIDARLRLDGRDTRPPVREVARLGDELPDVLPRGEQLAYC